MPLTQAINKGDLPVVDATRDRETRPLNKVLAQRAGLQLQKLKAPLPQNEKARVEALHSFKLLDRDPQEQLVEITRLAAKLCSSALAVMSFVDSSRVFYKCCFGLSMSDMARDGSFCSWAILEPEQFVVTDARQDVRFASNPLATARRAVTFYAAVPLITSDGLAIGALAVMDHKPRDLKPSQQEALAALAASAMAHIELERSSRALEQALAERHQAIESLTASEERYTLVVRSGNDGLWDWNLQTNEIDFSPRWKSILGFGEHELGSLPDEWFSRIHLEDVERVQADITSHLLGFTPHFQSEHRLKTRDGSYRWVMSRGLAAWDANRGVYRMAGSMTDVTERKESEERLLHNAYHDVLTGLPNRALFMDRLQRSLDRAKDRQDYLFAVLFLDVDRFKVVNDSLGHQVGDQLLVAIARRLEGTLRPGDMVARLGGDEFAIVLDHLKVSADATQAAERIQKELSAPFSLSGHEVFASVSIGIAMSLTPHDRPEDFIRNADTAMYRAKDQGRGRFEVFDKEMHARAIALLELETDLRRAITRNEFMVHYQPIVSLENWRIAGFEALLRWEHPERGFISPTKFIPVAEETGLIIPIGRWVLAEACKQLREWQQKYPSDPPLTVSVNLSGKQFSHPHLIEEISKILEETGLDARSLKIEITESAIIENIELATAILKQLKALGIRISLDDFGTGYSSLSYLHRFPIDTLKIDRSFVTRMNLPKNSEIVHTIVTLAVNLGMDVIAEGVETREQVIHLTGLDCEYVQGYLLSKPVDGPAMEELIEQTYQKGLGQGATDTVKGFTELVGAKAQPAPEKVAPLRTVELAPAEKSLDVLDNAVEPYVTIDDEFAICGTGEETLSLDRLPSQKHVYTESASSAENDNRRRCERFRLAIPVRVTGFDRKNGKWTEMTKTLDVSRTGVTIKLSRRVRHGMVLHAVLPLPIKLRSHGYSDSSFRVYTLVRRIDPAVSGQRLVALEFVGEQPPSGFLEKPWAVFREKNWKGNARRREPREERSDIVTIEFLDEEAQSLGQELALCENRSPSGMRVRLRKPPPEFDLMRVICLNAGIDKMAVVSNRFVGHDGAERLCLRYADK
ncbi:MAG TPA: EAL domain-containing protein [Blastocatellia bacterium]|nr:EAL domain-containing protein [Blastocatellia bacterium]